MTNEQTDLREAFELLAEGRVRYKITYGEEELSFSAPKADTNEELAYILMKIAEALKAPTKKVVGECKSCYKFILEDEEFEIIEDKRYCKSCIPHLQRGEL